MDTYGRITTPETLEELEAQNERLQGERSGFEQRIDSLSNALADERRRATAMEENVDSFIESLMNLVESGDIEDHIAEELADIFGRTLTRTVDVRMTIVLDAQVTVPVGYDLDDLHGDVDVEINPIYAADVQIEGIEVDSIEVEV